MQSASSSGSHKKNRQLQEMAANFAARLDPIPTPFFLCDITGAYVSVNQAFLDLLACPREQALGWNWTNFIHPEDRESVYRNAQNAAVSLGAFDCTYRLISTDGRTVHVHATSHPLLCTDEIVGFLGRLTDETEKVQLVETLRQREIFNTTMVDSMHEGVIVKNKQGEVIFVNPAAENILSLTKHQIAGITDRDPDWKILREDRTPFPMAEWPIQVAVEQNTVVTNVVIGIEVNGALSKWISVNAAPLRQPDSDEIDGAVSTFIDITAHVHFQELVDQQITKLNEAHIELELRQEALQQLNSKLKFQAETDALTLLYNRGAIMARLQSLFDSSTHKNYGVILLDIDHFKSINDNHGHQVGDQTLQLLASLLSEFTPNGASAGRYGGEEFLLVCNHCTPASLAQLAEEIRAYIEYIPDGPVRFTASIGTAHLTQIPNPKDLVKCADIALYESKNHGRNRVTNYAQKHLWGE